MSALALSAIHLAAEVLWGLLGRLVTKAFFEKLMVKLVLSGLDKLAASTENKLDDAIVADVKAALGAPDAG